MRVCMISAEFPPICGGIGYYVYNLSKKLIERGNEVTIITRGRWNRSWHYEKKDGFSLYEVRFIPIYPFHVRLHGIFVNKLLKSIESSFDVLHVHSPLVPVVHTTLPIVVTEHGTTKSIIAHTELLDIHSLIVKLFQRQLITIDRKAIKNCRVTTAVSSSCAKELQKYYGISENIIVVGNGVNPDFFVPIKKKRGVYILYTGQLNSKKGLIDLVKSAQYVCREHPKLKFILAGKGPLENHLKKLVHSLNLDRNFSFVGFVDRSTLLEYYQNATIYVFPSYYEGLPTTLLEAMSCGLPVVATDVDGTSEAVIDGETGYLVPPKNSKKLAGAILRLLADEELMKRMGEKAINRIKKHYDWGIIASKIEEIYRSIL